MITQVAGKENDHLFIGLVRSQIARIEIDQLIHRINLITSCRVKMINLFIGLIESIVARSENDHLFIGLI